MTGRLRAPIGLAATLLLVAPAGAAAGTARVDSFVAGRGSDTFRFVDYRAGTGELNRVTASLSRAAGTDTATLSDPVGVTPGAGCVRPNPADASTVRCTLGTIADFSQTAPQAFRLFLGDGDDAAALVPAPDVAAYIDGGPGDDVLTGGTGGGLIDGELPAPVTGNSFAGGPGDDTMIGGPNDDEFDEGGSAANGRDTMRGGRGVDRVSYAGRRRAISADLDGRRDDGERGEQDLIAGAEDLAGGRGDDHLTGDRRANGLRGAGGRDVLRGGAGPDLLSAGRGRTRDVLLAGPGADDVRGSGGANAIDTGSGPDTVLAGGGADRILARDRSPDELHCGRGRDAARLDGLDWVGGACERLRRRGTPRMAITGGDAGPLGGGSRFYAELSLGCPADFPAARCRALVAISYRGRLYARGRARVPRGASDSEVFVNFTRTGNREFAHVLGTIRARAKVTTVLPGGGRAAMVRRVALTNFEAPTGG